MASKRNQRRKACKDKVRHETREAAGSALRKIPPKHRHKMHVYPCPHCGGFHIGHRPQKKRTRRKDFI